MVVMTCSLIAIREQRLQTLSQTVDFCFLLGILVNILTFADFITSLVLACIPCLSSESRIPINGRSIVQCMRV